MIIVNEVIKWLSRLLLLVIPVLIGIFVYRKNQQEDEDCGYTFRFERKGKRQRFHRVG